MAGRLRLSDTVWPALAIVLAAGSALAWWALGPQGAERWGWHAPPHPAAGQPWRWWTASLVHVNATHLQANLWAAVVVALWGLMARVGPTQALAWCLAWPLAQALLITDPGSLSRYVGLSATLHAGAAIGCWHLLRHAQGARRTVGAAVSVAIGIKLVLEVPALQVVWSGIDPAAWVGDALPGAPGHQVAGHAHGCGVAAGLLAAALVDGIMGLCSRHRLHATPSP